jgi:hypothetical protein
MPRTPKIVMDPFASPDIRAFVQNGVDNYNIAVTGHAPYYPVGFYAIDADHAVLGGLMGPNLGALAPRRDFVGR